MSRSISRRSFLKAAGVGAAALGLAACGGSSSSSTAASAPASSAAAGAASGSGKPYEGVVLHYAATDTEATGNEMQDIVKMVKEKTGTDDIPAEQSKAAWFDADRKVLSEKVVGTADTTISQIWTSEGPLYGMGQQDLDTTMKNIFNRSNEAIKEAGLRVPGVFDLCGKRLR